MPLRLRRRRVLVIKIFAVLLLLAGIVWGVGYASYLPQVSVQTIRISGAKEVPPELIRNYAATILNDGSHHFLSRENIFLYPRAVIENAIVGYFPRIKSAHVSRSSYLSTTVSIAVEERQPFALWCSAQEICYEMDDHGFIFAEAGGAAADSRSGTEYVFKGGLTLADTSASSTPNGAQTSFNPIGRSFVSAHLPGLIALLRLLGQAGFTAEGATIQNEQDFSIPLVGSLPAGRQGFTLKASFGQNAETLTHNLQLVLSSDALKGKENNIEYIDLRFGDRVYYKLKGETQQASTQ